MTTWQSWITTYNQSGKSTKMETTQSKMILSKVFMIGYNDSRWNAVKNHAVEMVPVELTHKSGKVIRKLMTSKIIFLNCSHGINAHAEKYAMANFVMLSVCSAIKPVRVGLDFIPSKTEFAI